MPSYSVTVECGESDFEILLADLSGFETAGVVETGQGAEIHFSSLDEATRFVRQFESFHPRLAEIPLRNWAHDWQALWQSAPVGNRFFLAPPWDPQPTPAGRIRLLMRPGLVFGGGDHPTTQLCLELLEQHLAPGATMADIGCGSGILADAACALGAGPALCCDIAFDAALAARDVLCLAGRPPLAYCGSAGAIRTGWARLVTANLLTGIVVGLAGEFARILAPGGLLIASGFLEEQKEGVRERIEQKGFRFRQECERGDWAAAVFERLPPV